MRIVTGTPYPNNRWIVIDDNDEVIFDPAYETNIGTTLKACTAYVNKPESRPELHQYYGMRTDYGWDNNNE
jgi:hypothetical protein